MPNNWNTYKLSQVTTKIGSGSTPRGGQEAYKTSGTSLIRSQNILDFTFSTNGLAFIDDAQASKLNNVTLEEDDVLLNITGDSVARVCQVPKELLPARVNQHVAIIRANKEKLNSSFLKYSLLETSNKNSLLNMASAGATRQAITKSMIEGFEIKLPPFQEQQSIASILSAIDDKIENNLAINKTLEEMAMALYKHWFVDFGPFQDGEFVESELGMIPKGWEVKNLGDLYDTTSGGTPSRAKMEYYEDGTIQWIKSKELDNTFIINTEEKITEIALSKSSAKRFPAKSVLIAMYGATVGEIAINSEIATCNQAICAIKQTDLPYYYAFLFLKNEKENILNQAVGSAQQNISQIIIKNLKLVNPNASDVKDLFNEFDGIFNKLESNIKENQTLTQLRDTLLPQLISGAVRLKEFRE